MSRATLMRVTHAGTLHTHTPLFTRARARLCGCEDWTAAKTQGSRTAERSISLTEVLARNPDERRGAREPNDADKPPVTTATERLTDRPMVGDCSPHQHARLFRPARRLSYNRRLPHFLAAVVHLAPRRPRPIGPATSRLKPPSIPSNVSRLLYARINRRDSSFAIKSRYVRISKRRARKSQLVKTLLYAPLFRTPSVLLPHARDPFLSYLRYSYVWSIRFIELLPQRGTLS